jgi:hypothetical protein
MDVNQRLITFLRNMGVITDYKIKKDNEENKKFIYYPFRNLKDDEVLFLRRHGILITNITTHKGAHRFYNINNSIRTGRNHPFIVDKNGYNMTDCFDPNTKHAEVDNNDLYNICTEEYYLRNCIDTDTDACRWLKDRIITIKARHPDVYDYLLVRDKFPIPPHYTKDVFKTYVPKRDVPKRSRKRRSRRSRRRSRRSRRKGSKA